IARMERQQLTYDLLKTPENFFKHVKRLSASVAAIVIFGHRAPTPDSFWSTCVYDAMGIINPALEPGSYLPIEQFPILKYIPDFLAPSKARAKKAYRGNTAIYTEAQRRVEARRKEGDDRNSIADRILSGSIKLESKWSATETSNYFAVFHEAASDTTANMTLTDILYLAKNPWVQDKAQEELDRVCGHRMPVWEDFKDLPYINCIVKEGLRIRPVVPTGIPHRVSRDDWYAGYLIPKDSTIYLPAHSLNRLCPDPDTYNPDRYLQHPKLAMDYAGSPDYENRDHYAYGSGRRICVGIHLAERTQWRIIARLLWAFRIEPERDGDGREVQIEGRYREELLVQPEPFRVRFVPRSEVHVRVVQEGYRASREFLRKWE
ncbi:cytochrome P450, partial [Lophiostoma macrostomum CBS 122681]